MSRIRNAALAVALIAVPVAVSACTPAQIAAVKRAARQARPAVITCDEEGPCPDVRPPQRLDIRIFPNQNLPEDEPMVVAEQRCAAMGGQPHWRKAPLVLVCQGVDY